MKLLTPSEFAEAMPVVSLRVSYNYITVKRILPRLARQFLKDEYNDLHKYVSVGYYCDMYLLSYKHMTEDECLKLYPDKVPI